MGCVPFWGLRLERRDTVFPTHGYNERFTGTLRNEVLNAAWFHSVHQAQTAINVWLRQYNHIRPHHGLNMQPPVPETIIEKTKSIGTENWC